MSTELSTTKFARRCAIVRLQEVEAGRNRPILDVVIQELALSASSVPQELWDVDPREWAADVSLAVDAVPSAMRERIADNQRLTTEEIAAAAGIAQDTAAAHLLARLIEAERQRRIS